MTTDATFRSDVKVELVDFLGGDMRAVQAARVSTKGAGSMEEQKGGEGLINYLMRDGHHVPFEHTVFTFYVEAPIFVTRQLLKHRISSISEESGRYRELKGVFYVPADTRAVKQVGKTGDYVFAYDADAWKNAASEIRQASEKSWKSYEWMLENGISKEVARMVLPVNLYSSMYFTVNARSLMNIVKLRTSVVGSHPQYEIEQVGLAMEQIWKETSPLTYAAFEKTLGSESH